MHIIISHISCVSVCMQCACTFRTIHIKSSNLVPHYMGMVRIDQLSYSRLQHKNKKAYIILLDLTTSQQSSVTFQLVDL